MSSAPAAASAATPFVPRMRTAAAAPRLGPTGKSPTTASPIRSAVESSTEALTPLQLSSSQLRAICSTTATQTRPMMRLRPRMPRSTAMPVQNPSRRWRATRCIPPISAAIATKETSGTHQGMPSGPTRVKEQIAASAASTTTIGNSAASRTGARGHSVGAERRSAPIRTASPNWPLKMFPR